jgi:hypothetical protein
MLDKVPFEEFEAIVGQTVRITDGTNHVDLEVADAKRLANPSPREAPFAVTLRENDTKRAFGQGTYRLLHPTLGELDLFVVPVGPDARGMCYEITFN